MAWKRWIGILAVILLVIAFLVFISGVGLYYYIPDYVQNSIIPQFARQAGVEAFSLKVRKVGVTGVDIGSLSVGEDLDVPALGVDSVRIDYSPWLLFGSKRIDKIILSGVEVNCGFKDGRFFLSGFDLDKFLRDLKPLSVEESSTESVSADNESFSIGTLELRKAEIVFSWNGKSYRIPFKMNLTPDKSMNSFELACSAFPRGQNLNVEGSFDISSGNASLKFNSESLALDRFGDAFKSLKGAVCEGEASLVGSARMKLKPFKIESAEFELKNKDAFFSYDDFVVENPLSGEGLKVPWSVSMKYGGNVWKFSLSSIALKKPFPLKLDYFNASFSGNGASSKFSGACGLAIPSSSKGDDISLFFNEELAGEYAFCGDFNEKTGKWEFSFADKNKTEQSASFKFSGVNCEFKKTPLTVKGEGKFFEKASINLETGAKDLKFLKDDASLCALRSKLKADLKFLRDAKGNMMGASNIWFFLDEINLKNNDGNEVSIASLKLDAKTDIDNIENRKIAFDAAFKDLKLSIASPKQFVVNTPTLGLSGCIGGNCSEWERLSCNVVFSELYAMFDSRLKLANVSGEFPVEWPCKESSKKGVLNVKNISYDNIDLGPLDVSFVQKGLACDFNAKHINRILPGFSIDINGVGEISRNSGISLDMNFKSPEYKTQKAFDLGLFVSDLKGAMFDGGLSFNGSLSFKDGHLKGALDSKITDAKIEDENNGILIEKLNAGLSIDDILNLKSSPRQSISFFRASWGNLFVNDGKIDFQIESPESIFIEKSSFKWCGGNLYTQAMRIVPGKDNYDVTLFCDRIKLASLLEQLGVGKASGDGDVNGRLPFSYNDGKLDFQDGFLYSSPGEGGAIQLSAGDALMSSTAQNLPENDPRVTQLELVKEALKDFEYEWTKFSLNTVDDDLRINMVFDGKPSKPLPFRYSNDTGGWLKVDAEGEGSLLDIRLDVNYKIPLSKLMGYGRNVKDIVNKIK